MYSISVRKHHTTATLTKGECNWGLAYSFIGLVHHHQGRKYGKYTGRHWSSN